MTAKVSNKSHFPISFPSPAKMAESIKKGVVETADTARDVWEDPDARKKVVAGLVDGAIGIGQSAVGGAAIGAGIVLAPETFGMGLVVSGAGGVALGTGLTNASDGGAEIDAGIREAKD